MIRYFLYEGVWYIGDWNAFFRGSLNIHRVSTYTPERDNLTVLQIFYNISSYFTASGYNGIRIPSLCDELFLSSGIHFYNLCPDWIKGTTF